ncbi:MAG: dipeptide epimerase [Thermoprotei archaeon]|nr:MAG: dipeptide epimerase [Thermoprotei archaeon]
MKIVDLKWAVYRLENIQPFRIAYGVSEASNNIYVKVTLEDGTEGFGEACGSRRVTGEVYETIISFLKIVAEQIVGESIFNINRVIESLYKNIKGNTAAKAALDIALHDAWAKALSQPLYKALGGQVNVVESDYTIGIKNIDEMCKEAQNFVERGFKKLKIKVGVNPQTDLDIVKRIRESVGYDIELRVDANQAWSPKTAVKLIKRMERYEIEFVEQPVPAWDYSGLKFVKDRVDVPITADESVLTSRDALNLIRMDAVDLINIKLMKCGGIKEAIKIAHVAEAAGIKCMIGCMNESSLSIAAAAHLAMSTKNIVYYDLDSPLMLKNDPSEPKLRYEKGVIKLSDQPGIGISVEKVFS